MGFTIRDGVLIKYTEEPGVTEVTIPEGVRVIKNSAFAFCKSLTSVAIPEGVTKIEKRSFAYCTSLAAINIPKGVWKIGKSAFEYCQCLTAVTLPEGVTEIGMCAFRGCESLTSFYLPRSLKVLGWGVFWGCTRLTDVTISERAELLGLRTFIGCDSLSTITLQGENASRFPRPAQYKGLKGEDVFTMYCLFASGFRRAYIPSMTLHRILCTLLAGGYREAPFLDVVRACGPTLLGYAVANDDVRTVQALLTIGTITDQDLEAALARAVDCGAKESYLVLVNEKQKHGLFTDDTRRL